jgi:hypothetical protein
LAAAPRYDTGMAEPVMCTLVPEAIAAGRQGLLPGLADRAVSREATAEGYRLTFTASTDALQHIARVVDAERQCCRWLRVDLQVPPAGAPFVLTLSGPTGAREFLAALFDDGAS